MARSIVGAWVMTFPAAGAAAAVCFAILHPFLG
jgi:phosphate/sulfate permease